MKILHVCKYFYPRITGVTAHVGNLAKQQQAAGHAVAVASWAQDTGVREDQAVAVLRACPGDGRSLVGLMREFRPDLIHAHSIWETTRHAVAAARQIGCPYVITTHGTWHFLGYTGALDRWRDWLRQEIWQRRILWPRVLRGAGAVIALNALEEVEGLQAGVRPQRLRRIPNAVDPDQFRPGDRQSARQGLGWPDAFTVLFVGAMQAQKGIFTLIEAVAALESDRRPRLVFCGEGPDLESAEAIVAKTGIAATTQFLGRMSRERMPALYQAADVVALPSRQEPFATVLLEAMACARPCVGTNDGGTPEIIDDGRTGCLVAPGDSRVLSEMLAGLGRAPDAARAMGRAGRQKVEERFSWPLVAVQVEAAYRQALLALCLLALLLASCPALAASPVPQALMALEPSGQSQTLNPVWDGRAISLALARGETSGFQLLLTPEEGECLDDASLVLEASEGLTIRLYRVWDIWGVPEVAVPMEQGQPRHFPVLGGTAGQTDGRPWRAVVEVAASRQAPPRVRSGSVVLRWPGGERNFPLKLVVYPFALPRRPSLLVEMNSYGDCLRLLPATSDTLLNVHRLFRHFRTTFTLVPYRQDGTLLLDCLAPSARGAKWDFTAFDAAWAGLFDGSAFADGQPVSHWILPLHTDWPCSFAAPGARECNIAGRELLAAHILEKGWQATRFQEFHNENPEHGSVAPWRLDEPASERDLEGHTLFLDYRRAACREWGDACPLAYRLDISRWQPLAAGIKRLGTGVTDWSVSADPAFLDAGAVRFFRGLGAKVLLAYGELPGFMTDGQATPWTDFSRPAGRVFPAWGRRLRPVAG
ncbi:Glycosyltransferase [Desulfovibrio sp. DV]|uniref:glycosyltransferase family 4 protein n=1 Tax=Desulfovibrio sp. DV TaxID=1844708 RepID=UPI00094B7A40|nr:glycosyltransferase family 4 protein [Desulfovibrio sp. DV]OLN28944.1 Glycosyltransferase [Desulfovibrio sp. DV]